MTRDEIRTHLLAALAEVAPEADLSRLDPREDLREQLEIDSMDLLNIAIGVHRRTGVEIPEVDYPRLASLDSALAYLETRLAPLRSRTPPR
jgi:acyl carrier protein